MDHEVVADIAEVAAENAVRMDGDAHSVLERQVLIVPDQGTLDHVVALPVRVQASLRLEAQPNHVLVVRGENLARYCARCEQPASGYLSLKQHVVQFGLSLVGLAEYQVAAHLYDVASRR